MRLRLTVDIDVGRPVFTDDQGKEINGCSSFYWRDWIRSLIGNDRSSALLRAAGKIDCINSLAFYPISIFCPVCEKDVELVRKAVCWTEQEVIRNSWGHVTLNEIDEYKSSIQDDERYARPYVCPYCGYQFFKTIEEVREWYDKDQE